MSKITKIEQQKERKNRFNIFIDDNFAFGVDEEVLLKLSLTKDMELTEDFINNIIQAEEKNKGFNYAVSLLSYRQRSINEIKVKMTQKGYEESTINNAIDILKKYGYLNDYEFGKAFINDKQSIKKAGKYLIKQELYRKGIEKELIDKLVVETVTEDDEYTRAYQLAEKKLKTFTSNDDYNSKYRKLSGFLARKGYTFDIISRIIKELLKR